MKAKVFLPSWMIVGIDTILVVVSILVAYLLRFNFDVPVNEIRLLPPVLIFIPAVRLLTLILIRSYQGILKDAGMSDFFRIILTLIAGSVIFLLADLIAYFVVSHTLFIPLTIIILEFLITSFFIVSFRSMVRSGYSAKLFHRVEQSGTIIYGTGEEGIHTKHLLEGDRHVRYRILAFTEEEQGRLKQKIEGVDVVDTEGLADIFKSNRVDQVILVKKGLTNEKKQLLLDLCRDNETKLLTVPPINEWENGQLSIGQAREIGIEDFLERQEVIINISAIEKEIAGKTILITGAAGLIGSELVRQLILFNPGKVILVDQDENGLALLQSEFENWDNRDPLQFVLADICNESRMEQIFREYKPQIVYHAAAYKQPSLLEAHPDEAMSVNVKGAEIVAGQALQTGVEKFIYISARQAFSSEGVMGLSKRTAEKHLQSLKGQGETIFTIIRSEDIPKTGYGTEEQEDVNMQRFYLTLPEICQLILEAGVMAGAGGLFQIDMRELVTKKDIAGRMISLSGLKVGHEKQKSGHGEQWFDKIIKKIPDLDDIAVPTANPLIRLLRVTGDE